MCSALRARWGAEKYSPSISALRAGGGRRCAHRRFGLNHLLRVSSVSPDPVSGAPFIHKASRVVYLRGCPTVTPPSELRSRRDQACARRAANLGWCVCGRIVRVDAFRSRAAYTEYHRSGLCQDCQDRTFLSADEQTGVSHPLRRGLVVGAQSCLGAVAALPFVFTGRGRPIAWEARHCVLVGPEDVARRAPARLPVTHPSAVRSLRCPARASRVALALVGPGEFGFSGVESCPGVGALSASPRRGLPPLNQSAELASFGPPRPGRLARPP